MRSRRQLDGISVQGTLKSLIVAGRRVSIGGQTTTSSAIFGGFLRTRPNAPHIFSVVRLRDNVKYFMNKTRTDCNL